MNNSNQSEPLWKQRFRTSRISYARLAEANSKRGLVISNLSGITQLHAWDAASGTLQQVTHGPAGKSFGNISPTGKHIYYLKDEMGSELGHIVRIPFEGGGTEDITPDLPAYFGLRIAFSLNGQKATFIKSSSSGFNVYLLSLDDRQRIAGLRSIYQSKKLLSMPVLSNTGQFVAFQSTEHSGKIQFNLVVVDTESDRITHDVRHSNESSLQVCAFSPIASAPLLLGSTNESGHTRPFILDIETGRQKCLKFEHIKGELMPLCWSPGGQRILLCQFDRAKQRLFTYSWKDKSLTRFEHPRGSFSPDGAGPYFVSEDEIYTEWEDATQPSQVIALDGCTGKFKRVVLSAGEAPASKSWKSVSFPSSDQMPIQAWMAVPEGKGPFPAIIFLHGGPTAVTLEHYMPSSQAWLEHGFAFISINYHGSTTFGKEFQDKIIGKPGHWELKDIEAAYQWIVAQGIADPKKVFISGWSYGGYLTLLSLGRLPDYWAGGMAGIAIADWSLLYEEQAGTFSGYQVAIFGGTPDEKPQQHRISSPLTYVEDVRAPLLIIQGKNDIRCTSKQMEVYQEKLEQHGKAYTMIWFDAGHGTYAVDLQIEHQNKMMQFASNILHERSNQE